MEKKDFFLSYNKADKAWAKWLAAVLEEHNYSTHIQAWDIRPNDDFISKMNDFLMYSNSFIPILSKEYINSPYCKLECSAALDKSLNDETYRFIPIRVENIAPPDLIRTIVYIDIFDVDENNAEVKLVKAVDNASIPRKRPAFPSHKTQQKRPSFPRDISINKLELNRIQKQNTNNSIIEISELPISSHTKLFGFSERFSVYQDNNKFGYIDENGSYVTQPIFDYAGKFHNGYAIVGAGIIDIKNKPYLDKKGAYGYINKDGQLITPIHFEIAHNFNENLACVRKNNFFGYINEKNQTVIPFRFKFADSFSEGLAVIANEHSYHYIDFNGDYHGRRYIDYAEPFSCGLSYSESHQISGGFCGFADKRGSIIEIDNNLHFCGFNYTEGLCVVACIEDSNKILFNKLFGDPIEEKYGYIDKKGDLVIPVMFNNAFPFHDSRAVVCIKDEYGIIDDKGNIMFPLNSYDHIGNYCCGFALVLKDDKYGFIDLKGSLVIPNEYDIAYPFDDFITLVRKDNKWYKIENKNKDPYIKNCRAVSYHDKRKYERPIFNDW